MKKTWSLLLATALLCWTALPVAGLPGDEFSADQVTAESACLIDGDTGQVLFGKNPHSLRHPASITKVLTGLLVLENSSVQETLTVSNEAVQIPYNSSHVALTGGEELSVDSAMYALMLPSANDAANALAEHVAGTQKDFAARMTRRARELGARNSTFTNAHGLPDEEHLTTAYDMCLITREAVRTPGFLDYFGAARHTIPATNKQEKERPFTNQMYMLLPDMKWCYNPEVIGGKTGYTDEARHTMTSAARREDRTLVATVMGCGIDQKFDDTQLLFDYGFDSFEKVAVPIEILEEQSLPVTEGKDIVGTAVLTVPDNLTMLLPKGVGAGAIQIRYRLPASVEAGGEADAAAILTVQGWPDLVLEVPLTPQVAMASVPETLAVPASLQGGGEAPRDWGRWYRWLLILPAIPLLVLVGRAYRRHRRIRRRARLRLAHRKQMLWRQRQEQYRRSS